PDGALLAGMASGQVHVWDVATGNHRDKFESEPLFGEAMDRLVFSPDGSMRVAVSSDPNGHTVSLLWDLHSRKELFSERFKTRNAVLFGVYAPVAAISSDSRFVAVVAEDHGILVWDLKARREHARLRGHKGTVEDLVFMPDSQTLLSASSQTDDRT